MDPTVARILDDLKELLLAKAISPAEYLEHSLAHSRASSLEKEVPVQMEALDTETHETPVKIETGVVKSSKACDSESLSTCGITYDMEICSVSEKSGDDKPSKRHVSSSVPASNSSRAAGIFDVGAGDFAEDFLRANGLVEPKLHPGGWIADPEDYMYDTNQCGDSPGSIPIFHREQHSLPITPSDNSQGHMATGNSNLGSPRMFDALVQAWTRLTGKHLDYHMSLRIPSHSAVA